MGRSLLVFAVIALNAALVLVGAACDSRPVVPIDDEEDARPATPAQEPDSGAVADGAPDGDIESDAGALDASSADASTD